MFVAQRTRSGRSETRRRSPRRDRQAIALLRSFGGQARTARHKHLAPLGRSDKQHSVALKLEFADYLSLTGRSTPVVTALGSDTPS